MEIIEWLSTAAILAEVVLVPILAFFAACKYAIYKVFGE